MTRRLLLIAAALCATALASCKKGEDAQQPAAETKTTTAAAIPAATVPTFETSRAFADIAKQVAFGPRVPNSKAHDNALAFILNELKACTPDVQQQSFTEKGYKEGESLALTNVIASFNPQATWRVLILTHYDSRPWADEDKNPANKTKAVPAANDGASGTAVMLELARQFKQHPPPIGVDLFFDDGEDYGKYDVDKLDRYFLGVKHFVKTKPAGYNPRFAILLDMVGDKAAVFQPEANSVSAAPQFVGEIWRLAKELQLSHFKGGQGANISDDHFPLIEAGIPAVDLIDGNLVGALDPDPARKYWHTVDDLPKHLSEETIGQVGKLLLTLIYDRLPRDIPSL